jgi:hypothetical protein
MTQKPAESEYAPFYAGYVAEAPEGDVVAALEAQKSEIRRLAAAVSPERETFRYAPGKWSVREVFGHLIDAERVFGYRAFCIGRGDRASLPGFDEQEYMAASGYDRRALREIVDELLLVRESNLAFFRTVNAEAWARLGVANGTPISVRALAFITAGHARHHLEILRSRYGLS